MLRHNWVEVKDGILRQYPVYCCAHCMSTIRLKEVKDRSWNDSISELEWSRMTPDTIARCLGVGDDCELQLVKNITER